MRLAALPGGHPGDFTIERVDAGRRRCRGLSLQTLNSLPSVAQALSSATGLGSVEVSGRRAVRRRLPMSVR